jgi:ribose transport system permease protein
MSAARAAAADGAGSRLARALWPARGGWSGILLATVLLFALSLAVQPRSVSQSSLLGMLPFAAILAIAAAGQTLVIQQGGIDLSVPGVMSITIAIVTHYPNGDSSRLAPALAIALLVALAAGLASGFTVSRVGVMPIVTTLGMNALLFGGVLAISGGTPRLTTPALHAFTDAAVLGVPTTVLAALLVVATVAFVVKRTVAGRRFEAAGASPRAARAAQIDVTRYRLGAYAGGAVLYWAAAVLLAGVVTTPSVFQGNDYLLPAVAAVVLGGTSLLGGSGSVVASALGALFLTQLQQLALTTGASTGSSTWSRRPRSSRASRSTACMAFGCHRFGGRRGGRMRSANQERGGRRCARSADRGRGGGPSSWRRPRSRRSPPAVAAAPARAAAAARPASHPGAARRASRSRWPTASATTTGDGSRRPRRRPRRVAATRSRSSCTRTARATPRRRSRTSRASPRRG